MHFPSLLFQKKGKLLNGAFHRGNINLDSTHNSIVDVIEKAIQDRYRYVVYLSPDIVVNQDMTKFWKKLQLQGYFVLRAEGREKHYHPVDTSILGLTFNDYQSCRFFDWLYNDMHGKNRDINEIATNLVAHINTQPAKLVLQKRESWIELDQYGTQIFKIIE